MAKMSLAPMLWMQGGSPQPQASDPSLCPCHTFRGRLLRTSVVVAVTMMVVTTTIAIVVTVVMAIIAMVIAHNVVFVPELVLSSRS